MKRELIGVEVVESVPAHMAQRMRNWARWCGARLQVERCSSIEGRYEPENTADTKRPAVPPMDSTDAVRIESVMRFLPKSNRDILKLHYIQNQQEGYIVRKAGIRRTQFRQELRKSVLMVLNRADAHACSSTFHH